MVRARAIADYEGDESAGTLSLKEGHTLIVTEQQSSGWWVADVDGRTGLVPSTYVEIISEGLLESAAHSFMNLLRPKAAPNRKAMTRSKRTSTVSTRPHGIATDVLQLFQPVETQLPSPVRTLPTVAQTPSSSSQRQSAAPVKVSALAIGGRGGGTRVDAAAEANTTVSGSSLAQPSAGAHNDDTYIKLLHELAASEKANVDLRAQVVELEKEQARLAGAEKMLQGKIEDMETRQRIRLSNRDSIEDGLRKELKESRAMCEDMKHALENSQKDNERLLKERIAVEQDKIKQMHQSEIDAVQSQVTSLTSELTSMRLQHAGHAKLVDRNKELSSAVAALDAAFVESEKKLQATAATIKQFEALRKKLDDQCASVPKLQKEVAELKQKLKESLAVTAEVGKMEEIIKKFAVNHDKLKDEAAAAQDLRMQVSRLTQQLGASADASHNREKVLGKLSDEIMVMKLQAALKLKAEKLQLSPEQAAEELLQDVAFWRKKCINTESELHALKVAIGGDALRHFLALALAQSPAKTSIAGPRGV